MDSATRSPNAYQEPTIENDGARKANYRSLEMLHKTKNEEWPLKTLVPEEGVEPTRGVIPGRF